MASSHVKWCDQVQSKRPVTLRFLESYPGTEKLSWLAMGHTVSMCQNLNPAFPDSKVGLYLPGEAAPQKTRLANKNKDWNKLVQLCTRLTKMLPVVRSTLPVFLKYFYFSVLKQSCQPTASPNQCKYLLKSGTFSGTYGPQKGREFLTGCSVPRNCPPSLQLANSHLFILSQITPRKWNSIWQIVLIKEHSLYVNDHISTMGKSIRIPCRYYLVNWLHHLSLSALWIIEY